MKTINNLGRIYKITSPFTDKCYIGSTRKTIHQRFWGHKTSQNSCASKELIQLGDPKIELLEEVNDISNLELRILEQQYMDKNDCINKQKALRKSKLDYDREYQRQRRRNMKSSWITL